MREIIEQQANCKHSFRKPVRFLERLSHVARADFEGLLHASSYPPNTVIFTEGDPAAGLHVVLEREVRTSIGSTDGKHPNLRIARKGEVLGLSSVLAAGTYNATAETLYPAKLAYIARETFVAFLSRHPSTYMAVVEELSRKVSTACEQLRMVALSHSAPEKLARLLLEWSENGQTAGMECRIRFSLTHEQIGEFIGASRETVTRTLASFRDRQLVKFQGSVLTIPDREVLANYASV